MVSLTASLSSILVVAIVSMACSPYQTATDSSWSVQLKTSGGLTGRGQGSISVNSDGKVRYEPPNVPGRPGRPCERVLSADDLRPLADAVRRNRSAGWQVPGPNAAAPDAFAYDLELRTGGDHAYRVTWYDNTRDRLPEDVKSLAEALTDLMSVLAKGCGT